MTRITLLVNSLMSGGTEKQVILTAIALQQRHAVQLISYYGDQWDGKHMHLVDEHNIDLVQLHGSHLKRSLSLIRHLKTHQTQVLFCYLATANILGGICGKVAGVKHIVGGIRNAWLSRNKLRVQRFFHNYIYRYTVFNNHCGKERMGTEGFKASGCVVINNCFINEQPERSRSPKDKTELLSVGRFVAQKDYYTALQAVQAANQRIEDKEIHYTIVGYGVLESKIREWIEMLGLGRIVEVVINPADLVPYFEKADIFINSSLFEGQSNAILEAMSFSLPVVASDVGDNGYLVVNEKTGLVFPAKDHLLAANNIYRLCQSYEERNELGKNGFIRLEQEFSFESYQAAYEKLLERMIK